MVYKCYQCSTRGDGFEINDNDFADPVYIGWSTDNHRKCKIGS